MNQQQATELLNPKTSKSQRKRNKLDAAIAHQKRLRLHSEVRLSAAEVGQVATPFLNWVKGMLSAEKFANLMSVITYPVDTVRLIDEAVSAFVKVFDGRDPSREWGFTSPEAKKDFIAYKMDPQKWRTIATEAMKSNINALQVIDLPKEQIGALPEPYMYFLKADQVHDYEFFDNDDKLQWVIFDTGEGEDKRRAIYCDGFYRIYKLTQSDSQENSYTLEYEAAHTLKACPVRFYWDVDISSDNPALKQSPFTAHLGALDWILFWHLSKKYGDLYSPWTIYWGFEKDCEYEDKHYRCDGGFLRDLLTDHYIFTSNRPHKCPVCSERINGVGSFVEVPVPEEGKQALTPPVGKVDVDVNSLDFNVKELERLEQNFYKSVTGSSHDVVSNKAINEDQVKSLFEGNKQVLLELKINFEKAESWMDEMICRLRYGDQFQWLEYNYGTDFYLGDSEQLLAMYANCKSENMDHSILDELQDQYFETKHKANPKELERAKIITDIDPFRHATKAEVTTMMEKGYIEYKDYMMKVNFSTFLKRFEREQGDLTEFGSAIQYSKKIEAIKNYMYDNYITQPIIQEKKLEDV